MLLPSLLLLPALLAQGERLSGPMVGGTSGDVLSARMAGDTGRVVYLADARQDEFSELWTVPKDASAPARRLHGHLESEVLSFDLTPDGVHVVYRTRDLFLVPSDGSRAPLRLSAPLPPEGRVGTEFEGFRYFWIDPTGTRVAYLADATVDDFLEVFVVPLDGSAAPVRLSAPDMGEADIGFDEGLVFTPAGDRVVFQILSSLGQRELWSAPSDGSALPVRIATLGSPNFADFRLTPAGTTVVFRATLDATGRTSLFRVPVTGAEPPTILHPTLLSAERIGPFAIGVGGRVLFEANLTRGTTLFSVPFDGSTVPRRLSPLGELGSNSFQLVPGRGLAVFANLSYGALFVVPLDGSTGPRPLTSDVSSSGSLTWIAAFAPDGSRLLYFSGSAFDEIELHSVPLDGPATSVKLNSTLGPEDQVWRPSVFAQGNRVAFLIRDRQTGPYLELWTALIDGSAPPTRLAASSSGLSPGDFDAHAQLDELVFRANSLPSTTELFWSRGTGGAPPLKLNGPLPGGPAGGVQGFLASPDDRWVVYRADQEVDERHELFSVNLRTRSRAKLNGALAGNLLRERFQITPDSRHVVYQADQSVAGRIELYSAPLDGSAPSLALTPGLASDPEGTIRGEDFLITPSSARVVFLRARRLWSVPVDGSASPLQLDTSVNTVLLGALAPRLTSTPERVVYSAGSGSAQVLKVVAVDGSTAPLTLPTGGRVAGFEPTADGMACVYLQRASATTATELFVVPLDASAAPLKLSHPLTAPNEVLEFVAEDGALIAYLAADPEARLWITARDGSLTPFEASAVGTLHGPVRTGSVQFIDGGRIAYLADSTVGPSRDLWSVPLDGSAPPVRLNGAPGSSNVESYRPAPGFERIVYRAVTDVMGLWSAPTDGSTAPVRLSHRASGVEYEYSLSSDGWAAYAQFSNGTRHLFLVPIDASRPRRQASGSDIHAVGVPIAFAGDRLLYTAVELPWFNSQALF
ncbi:MAG: hypothetical protein ABL998_04580, partial [Planctomycetota bacterium]